MWVDWFWREGGSLHVRGWCHAGAEPVERLAFVGADGLVPASDLVARPDLLPHYPAVADGARRAGFVVTLPRHFSESLTAEVTTARGVWRLNLVLPARMPLDDAAIAVEDAAVAAGFARFCATVNDNHQDVLEIGARRVGITTTPLRAAVPGAARVVGMDVHPGENVDLVGDVHHLTELVGAASFDAVYSVAVLEHLALPWVAAQEMNRVLRPGGLVWHVSHQTWPLHETPNDFWRFSDEAMRILFGPVHGFEVLAAGMAFRMRIYPEARGGVYMLSPSAPGYGNCYVLARKVAEIDTLVAPDVTASLGVRYPVAGS